VEQQEADRVVEQSWELVEWGLRAWLQPDGFGWGELISLSAKAEVTPPKSTPGAYGRVNMAQSNKRALVVLIDMWSRHQG